MFDYMDDEFFREMENRYPIEDELSSVTKPNSNNDETQWGENEQDNNIK